MISKLIDLIRYNKDWPKYLYYKYFPPGNGDVVEFRLRTGDNVQIDADGRFVLNEIFLNHVYDVPGVDLTDAQNILDLGANVGVFTLYALSRSPNARVFSFEPSARNFQILNGNLASKSVRATAYRMAASNMTGTAVLNVSNTSVEYALNAGGADGEFVDCIDLKGLFELTGVDVFDMAKIDIEGAERDLLDGAPDDLLRRFRAISIEWHYTMPEAEVLANRLRGLGFRVSVEKIEGCIYLKGVQVSS